MREIIRSNDPVRLSWLRALLRDQGIETVVFDGHMSVMEGSISAILRRLMVVDSDFDRAREILAVAEEDAARGQPENA